MDQMVPWEFDKDKAVLLIVDMQNDFVNEGAIMEVPAARQKIPNMKKLIDFSRHHNIPVIYTVHVLYDEFDVSPLEIAYQPWLKKTGMREGTDGIHVVEKLKPLPGEKVIKKHRFDAFYNTDLDTILRNIKGFGGIDTVIITGTVTDICCESTARSAFMRDYKVVFVGDACGGLDETSHEATLNVIDRVFGRVMNTEDLLKAE